MLHLRRQHGAKFHKPEQLRLTTFLLRTISFHAGEDLAILFHANSRNQSSLRGKKNLVVFNSFRCYIKWGKKFTPFKCSGGKAIH